LPALYFFLGIKQQREKFSNDNKIYENY